METNLLNKKSKNEFYNSKEWRKTRAEMLGETTSANKKPRGKKSKDNESYIKEI